MLASRRASTSLGNGGAVPAGSTAQAPAGPGQPGLELLPAKGSAVAGGTAAGVGAAAARRRAKQKSVSWGKRAAAGAAQAAAAAGAAGAAQRGPLAGEAEPVEPGAAGGERAIGQHPRQHRDEVQMGAVEEGEESGPEAEPSVEGGGKGRMEGAGSLPLTEENVAALDLLQRLSGPAGPTKASCYGHVRHGGLLGVWGEEPVGQGTR